MNASRAHDPANAPAGFCILAVEDEMMVAMMLEEMLTELGCRVVKAARIATALQLVANEAIDAAILDVNVAGEPVYAVAQELCRRSIPFAFATGYGAGGLRADFRDWPVLPKPFHFRDLRQLVATGFASYGVQT